MRPDFQLVKKFYELVKNEDVLYNNYILTGNEIEDIPGFIDMAKTVTAGPGEDVWVTMTSFKNRNHRNEYVEHMAKNKDCQILYQQFTELISHGSKIIHGGFNKLS